MFPPKLKPGDQIRVVAPSRSLSVIPEQATQRAVRALQRLGFHLTFGEHVNEVDTFASASTISRIRDLHRAYADAEVSGILTAIGGFNSNALLRGLDYQLISDHPKILCGFSDVSVLLNAVYAVTGQVTYHGPHFSSFGVPDLSEYIVDSFCRACMIGGAQPLGPSMSWADDRWYDPDFESDARRAYREKYANSGSVDPQGFDFSQETYQQLPALNRIANQGPTVLQEGLGEGFLVGGNLCSFALLFGTPYMPRLEGSILLVEDIGWKTAHVAEILARDLESVSQQPGFDGVRGILIGRFLRQAEVTVPDLRRILSDVGVPLGIPIVANLDFGHTLPLATLPIGAQCSIDTRGKIMISVAC